MKSRFTIMLLILAALADIVLAGQVVYVPFDDSIQPTVGAERVTVDAVAGVSFIAGRRGKAVMLTEAASPLCCEGVASLLSTEGTLEFWVRPSGWKGIDRNLRFSLSLAMGDAGVRMFTDPARSIMVTCIQVAGTTRQYISPIHYWGRYTRQDQHIAITRSGSEIGIWIDGQRSVLSDKPVEVPADCGAAESRCPVSGGVS